MPVSVSVANTTYGALSMLNGDDFARKFEEGDSFKLTISGLDGAGNESGSIEIYLADFRPGAGEGYILDTWLDVDLTPLGSGLKEITFSLESTDTGDFGMNTPSFVAVDNLVLEATPVWGGFHQEANGWVDTGSFLGWVYPSGDHLYILKLDRYGYMPEPPAESGQGAWMYLMR
jgi:hypothetical protein